MKRGKKRGLDDKRKERERQIRRFFKPNKNKIITALLIISASLIFQAWQAYSKCLQIFCEPLFFGILYYLFWPFELLTLILLGWVPPNTILLFIGKIIFIFLQAVYWYIISCAVAVPLNKLCGKIGVIIKQRRRELDRIMNEKIARDVRRAEELEREKIRLEANRF